MVKDNVLFVQEARHAGKTGVAGLAWWMPASLKLITNNMLLKDEPDHRRLRKLVDQAFHAAGCGICAARSRAWRTNFSTASKAARKWTWPPRSHAACRSR
ncbi:hypothetical protein [Methyloceanibacter marginalis]|uniref:hypothetical protein n=1 Tax=Methyloceanibacter marginalis TaxID=1774971 RepID=UPI001301938A|nr:hypothetical protein [Methyloceanibacter marginalis]